MQRKRTNPVARKIEESYTGRILWEQGIKHLLDILSTELDQLHTLLLGQLKAFQSSIPHTAMRLRTILETELQSDDLTKPFTHADCEEILCLI